MKINVNYISYDCKVSDIILKAGDPTPCCDGIFFYEPVVLDFGDTEQGNANLVTVLQSNAATMQIITDFQVITLLCVMDMILMGKGQLGIKFNSLLIQDKK